MSLPRFDPWTLPPAKAANPLIPPAPISRISVISRGGPAEAENPATVAVLPISKLAGLAGVDPLNLKSSPQALSRPPSQGMTLAEIHAAVSRWPDDLCDLYEERAAIIKYCGLETREVAERRAFDCYVGEVQQWTR